MSVIIRLQGLPWSASALDIRHFFKGLTIPAGGVHIIGGERGDAFIAFSSDEDARQAMMRNMSAINGTPVQLYLSSKSEMQSVIEEARATETSPTGGNAAAATLQQQPGMQQNAGQALLQQGGGQGIPGIHSGQSVGNQRFPMQTDLPVGRDLNQGQLAGNQNLMNQGHNPLINQAPGQTMPPGQHGRDNLFGMQNDRIEGMAMNQNFQGSQQHPNQGGLNSQYGFTGDRNQPNSGSRGQMNQTDANKYGMESGYSGNNFNQWNIGQMQGQGPASDFGSNQQFYGGDDSSQGQFQGQLGSQRPDQFNQSAQGRGGPFSQQQFPGQGGEPMPKSDNLGFNQQGGFGLEGVPKSSDGSHFPVRGGRQGHEMNKGGLLPHPVMSAQTSEQGRIPDSQGQIPPRTGPGSRGTPDDLPHPIAGRPEPQPLMDQWPTMNKGQEPGRPGGHMEENYPPEGREGFPPRRGEGFPPRMGMQQEFPGGPRKRGMLPTPNVPDQGQQPGHSNEPFSDMDIVEEGQWPDSNRKEFMNRGGSHERGMDPGRDLRRDPDFRRSEQGRSHGPYHEGDSDFRGSAQRPSQFEGPGGRPFDGTRGSFEGAPDRRSMERGPEGRLDRGPDGRPLDRGFDRGPFERGPDGRPPLRGPEGNALERGPDGRPLERGADRRSLERGPDGRPLDRGPDGRPLDRGPNERPFELGLDMKERGPDRRFSERGPDGRPVERPMDRGPDGRPFERGLNRRPLMGDPEGRQFDHSGHFEAGFEPGGRFDGPPDRRFVQHEGYDPMEMEYDPQGYEEPVLQGPHDGEFLDAVEFENFDRGFGGRGGRGGMEGRRDGPRGRGGFERGRGRGFGRDFPPRGHAEEAFPEYPMEEGFDSHIVEDMPHKGMHGFGEEFGKRDFDSRRDADRGRGGRMDGPGHRGRGRSDRGRGRFDGGHGRDMDTDRRRGGPLQEDIDSRHRDRNWNDGGEEFRGTGKGLLGDAPVGLLPAPAKKDEESELRTVQHRDSDLQRDRDRRGHSDRRDRDDRGRDDRSGRRSDRWRSRERSTDRDRYSRRNDRDRDRNERRDSERSKDKERDRLSSNRDRDSRSRDASSKDAANGKRENEKDSGKNEKKSDDQKKSDTDSSQSAENKFIHAKGFPSTYNYREIRRFFLGSELPFDGIKLTNNAQGQRTGEVYLKFVNEEAAKRAMKKNGETVSGNPVSLSFISGKIFESQVDSQMPLSSSDTEKTSSGPSPVIKKENEKSNLTVMIKGLPFNIKKEDLLKFFSSVKIAGNGDAVFIEYDNRNQATGVAYMEAASVQDFNTAVGFDGRIFGSRTLNVSPGRKEDMDLCMKKQQEMFQRNPNKAGEQQTSQAPNTGAGVMGARPPLMGQAPGRPSPQSLLSLMNPMNMPLLQPRNGPAFDPSLQRQQQHQQSFNEKPQNDQGPSFCVHIQGLPMLASYKDIREFFGGLNIVPHRGIQIVHDGIGKPMGEGFVEFATQEDKETALKKDKTSMGRHILAVKSVAKLDMIERLRNARFVGMPPGQGPPGQASLSPRSGESPNSSSLKPIPPGVLNRQWCYLSCQNFPPAVSITDILNFFQGYNPVPESIRLHYAADGSPTGNAVVGFMKMEEANRALQELNGKLCRRSAVTLMPAV